MYLADPSGQHQAKIERAIFLDSLFNVSDTAPALPNWPLGLTSYASIAGGFSLGCPGQRDAGIVDVTALDVHD